MSVTEKSISEATSIDELLPVLKRVRLTDLKQLAIAEYNKLDDITKNEIQIEILQINNILPDELIQHILSFEYSSQSKPICSVWNKLAVQNEQNAINKRNKIVADELEKFDAKIKSKFADELNPKIYIVDKNRTQLTDDEKEKGYLGPYRNLDTWIEEKNDEQSIKVLIYPGTYIMDPIQFFYEIQFIQLIGIGGNVTLKYSKRTKLDEDGEEYCYFLDFFSQTYLENICIDCSGKKNDSMYWWAPIRISEEALFMKNCSVLGHGTSLEVDGYTDLSMINCNLSSRLQIGEEAVDERNINIIGCEFQVVDDDSVWATDWIVLQCTHETYNKSMKFVSFRCIGNIFRLENMYTADRVEMYPICMEHGSGDGHNGKDCLIPKHIELKDNILRSFYQRNNNNIIDANTMYYWSLHDTKRKIAYS